MCVCVRVCANMHDIDKNNLHSNASHSCALTQITLYLSLCCLSLETSPVATQLLFVAQQSA